MKRIATAIVSLFVGVALIAGCSSAPTYQAICVNRVTKTRVDDYRCNKGGLLYVPYYIHANSYAPPIGKRANGGQTAKPKGKVKIGGAPKSGGKVNLNKSKSGGLFGGSKSGGSKGGSSGRSGGYSSGGRGK